VRRARHITGMGDRRDAYKVLMWKPERRRPLGKPSIKMEGSKSGMGCMDWIELAQDRDRWLAVVYAVMKLWVPYNA
jgi:hypothetical protein